MQAGKQERMIWGAGALGLSASMIAAEVVLAASEPSSFAAYFRHAWGIGAAAVLLCWMCGSAALVACALLMPGFRKDPVRLGLRGFCRLVLAGALLGLPLSMGIYEDDPVSCTFREDDPPILPLVDGVCVHPKASLAK